MRELLKSEVIAQILGKDIVMEIWLEDKDQSANNRLRNARRWQDGIGKEDVK
jgi:hypothetical protein